jgi:hypothetical protein
MEPKEGLLAQFQERHYSVAELAERWNLSKDSIRRMFENEPGVLSLQAERRAWKRVYKTLRIPQSVAERVYRRNLVTDSNPSLRLPQAVLAGREPKGSNAFR